MANIADIAPLNSVYSSHPIMKSSAAIGVVEQKLEVELAVAVQVARHGGRKNAEPK
jgi:hypothetical protein